MKKKMLATTLLTGLLAACSGNSASVTGVWIEPIPGMEDQVQGIKLEEGGIASSVNMATLVYKNWKTIEFIDTMKIKKITADSLVLDNRGMEIRYAKQK